MLWGMSNATMTVAEDMREDEIVQAHRAAMIARRLGAAGGYMHDVAAECVGKARRLDDLGRRWTSA